MTTDLSSPSTNEQGQLRVVRLDPSTQGPSKEQSGLMVLSSLLSVPSEVLRDPKKAAVYETLFNQQDLYLVALTLWESTKKHEDLGKQPVFFEFGEEGSLDSDVHDDYHRIVSEEDAARLDAIDRQIDGCMFMSRHIGDRVFVIRVLFGHPEFPVLFEYHGLHPTANCITREPGRTIEFSDDMMMYVSDSPRYFSELYSLHAALLSDSGCSPRDQPAAKKFWTGARVTYVGGNLGVSSGAKAKFCSFGNIVNAVEAPLKEDQHVASINLIREEYLTGQAPTTSAYSSGSKNRSAPRRKPVPPPAPSSSEVLAYDYANSPVTPTIFVGFDCTDSPTFWASGNVDGGDGDDDYEGLGKKRRRPSDDDDEDDGYNSPPDDGGDNEDKEPPAKRPCPAKTRSTIAVIDLTYTSADPDPDEEDLLRSPFVREASGGDMDVDPAAAPLIGLPIAAHYAPSEPLITLSQFQQAMAEMKSEYEHQWAVWRQEMEAKLQLQQQQQQLPAPVLDQATKTLLDNLTVKLADAMERLDDLESSYADNAEGCEHECDTEELEEQLNERIKSVKQLSKTVRKEFDVLKMDLNDSMRALEKRLDMVNQQTAGGDSATEEGDASPMTTQHDEQLKELTAQMAKVQATINLLSTQYQTMELQTLTYNTNLTKFQQSGDAQCKQIGDLDTRIKKMAEALRQLKPLVEGVDQRLKGMQTERSSSSVDTTPVLMDIDVPSTSTTTTEKSASPEPLVAGPEAVAV